jgi:hypothetical protein
METKRLWLHFLPRWTRGFIKVLSGVSKSNMTTVLEKWVRPRYLTSIRITMSTPSSYSWRICSNAHHAAKWPTRICSKQASPLSLKTLTNCQASANSKLFQAMIAFTGTRCQATTFLILLASKNPSRSSEMNDPTLSAVTWASPSSAAISSYKMDLCSPNKDLMAPYCPLNDTTAPY